MTTTAPTEAQQPSEVVAARPLSATAAGEAHRLACYQVDIPLRDGFDGPSSTRLATAYLQLDAEVDRLRTEVQRLREALRAAQEDAAAARREGGAVQALRDAADHLEDARRKAAGLAAARRKDVGGTYGSPDVDVAAAVGTYRSAAGRVAGLTDAITVLTDRADAIEAGEDL